MKITGVTIIKNALKNDYPIVEAINSILPMVNEMIVSIDRGEDDTENLIKSIVSDKIKIIYSTWDMNLREGGKVYALETDKVLTAVSADTDWIFYIQADEVIHEKYQTIIIEEAKKYQQNDKVQGLLFKYLHFYANYNYVGDSRKWYNYEVRMIKNDKRISSYKDAQGFRIGHKKLDVVLIDAEVYHYGWVKSPQQMKLKQKNVVRYYHNDDEKLKDYINSEDFYDFNSFDSLRKFTGTHPIAMEDRIKAKNWNLELDITKKNLKFKDRILYYFENLFGIRLFDFRNYKIISK